MDELMDKLKLFSVAPHKVTLDNGSEIHLRRLSALERVEWLDALPDDNVELTASLESSAKLVTMSVCDSSGARTFTDEEIIEVKKIDCEVFNVLVKEAMLINGMGGEGKAAVEKKQPTTDTSITS
jgi:hypothetical protein